ncbi:HD-GYP domain-containing protein [Vibrio sp. 10N.239.312.D08]|uniref:HD-GYP domain-containing protein n=1 Tax=Vibrio sp. 10N.239.312.D08 TaxID=3229978 RepID=UPI003550B978
MLSFRTPSTLKLPVHLLQVGMYVTSIQSTSNLQLSSKGLLKNKNLIKDLIDSDVLFVVVDEKKSENNINFNDVRESLAAFINREKEVKETPKYSLPKPRKSNCCSKFRSAKSKNEAIMVEAKAIATKVLNKAFEGEQLTASDFDEWSESLLEKTLGDFDAFRFASALRTKDEYLLEHSISVSTLLVTFAKYLGFDEEHQKSFAIGGLIHDVGKIKVDSSILNKPSRLTPEEFEHMKLHQVFAKEILTEVDDLPKLSLDVALMHHEKLDGNGYPLGLSNKEIPIHGRMASIVDIFDALTADRVYKKSMSPLEAFKIMLSMTPQQLDRELLYKFINCLGIYPVASLVELSNGIIAIVWESNAKDSKRPIVKLFYSKKNTCFITIEMKDLSKSGLTILRSVSPSEIEADISAYFL